MSHELSGNHGGRGMELSHRNSVLNNNVLSELWESGQLCDAVIKVDYHRFSIHRLILSTVSPYFRVLFTNELFQNSKREFEIQGVSIEMMGLIIQYAYTRNVPINNGNVEQLLIAADQFLVNGLVKACSDFLVSQLNDENCIGIHQFSHTYFCHNLERAAWKYVMQNFTDVVSNSAEFLNQNVDDMRVILLSDELNVKSEETVFEAVVKWVTYDPESRRQHMSKLLSAIRLGHLSKSYFVEHVKSHPYVKDDEDCKPIVIEALKKLFSLDFGSRNLVVSVDPLSRPRMPHEMLFVIGGWYDGCASDMMETYDTRADRWVDVGKIDSGPRAYHGTVALGQMIYVIGGFDGTEYLNSCRTFDPVARQWSEFAPMNCKRCYISTAVHESVIYAFGGSNGEVRQRSAEKYQPSRNQWSLIASMHTPRSDASATELDGKIYICGGFNGQDCMDTAECYDPEANQWTNLPSMRSRRSGLGVISYRGSIYGMGGFNGIARLKTAERYNPTNNRWQPIPEMYDSRSNFAAEVIDDMIFAIGGFEGFRTTANVECYDGSTDEWYDANRMTINRSAASACVVRDLPNIHDYIYKDRDKHRDRRATKR